MQFRTNLYLFFEISTTGRKLSLETKTKIIMKINNATKNFITCKKIKIYLISIFRKKIILPIKNLNFSV